MFTCPIMVLKNGFVRLLSYLAMGDWGKDLMGMLPTDVSFVTLIFYLSCLNFVVPSFLSFCPFLSSLGSSVDCLLENLVINIFQKHKILALSI